jgi:predicted nucleotidyltransferase component of viral defense system
MIKQASIDIAWIKKASNDLGISDYALMEKAIRAFLLLEGLANQGITFVFKGGTSLILLLKDIKRLSIDIDIIMPKEDADIGDKFRKLCEQQNFLSFEQDNRDSQNSTVPKAHFRFTYQPLCKTNQQSCYILLDILYDSSPYISTMQIPIETGFLPTDKPLANVTVPSIDNILGDKLTAFAPNTSGIPYFKSNNSRSMEIIKQLFDIGNLFDNLSDIKTISKAFSNIAIKELEYRKIEQNPLVVADDIIQTSLCLSSRGLYGKGNISELISGIKKIKKLSNYRQISSGRSNSAIIQGSIFSCIDKKWEQLSRQV